MSDRMMVRPATPKKREGRSEGKTQGEGDVSRRSSVSRPFKLAFINVRYKPEITLPPAFVKKLPTKVLLFTNIQFHPQYGKLKAQLEDAGKTVRTVRPKHAWNEGQILGCSIEDWSSEDVDAFVYVGDGLFHPKALLFKNAKPVHIYNPLNRQQEVLSPKDIDRILKRRKGALVTFHTARRVGVVITTKYGQNRLERALQLGKQYPDKTFYYLLDDVIDFSRLEDFPFLEVFINTACPRLMDDHDKFPLPVLNIEDLTGEVW